MGIKILYYVDVNDKTKGALVAFPNDNDIRTKETIDGIGKMLHEANFGDTLEQSKVAAWEAVYNGSTEMTCSMGKYEFGWEETELWEK